MSARLRRWLVCYRDLKREIVEAEEWERRDNAVHFYAGGKHLLAVNRVLWVREALWWEE